jgi:DMSO/TMAO reductase YedYZ heme-binding membrane subunit
VNPQVWWYTARAAGLIAWLMLTASVIWGIVLSTGAFPRHRRPAWLLDLHRWLGGLTLGFVAVHVGALVGDNYVHFGLADVTVPFASGWHSGAVALGIVAAWLLVAVELTSLAIRRLPRRAWRAIHLTSYLVFWLTSLHAAYAGTDATNRLYRVTTAVTIAVVAWAIAYRLADRHRPRRRPRRDARPAMAPAVRRARPSPAPWPPPEPPSSPNARAELSSNGHSRG